MAPQKSRLGRGLDSLVSAESTAPSTSGTTTATAPLSGSILGSVQFLPLDKIKPNPLQPRSEMDPGELAGLVDSMRTSGLLQPILVRRHDSAFQLIVGERRWRAARQAGLKTIPAIVREASEADMLELALIENIQRSDLNPIDRATAYASYITNLALTQEQASHRLGQDRATIANYIRLLELDQQVQKLVAQRQISMGHARALLALSDPAEQRKLAKLTSNKNLSVRRVEALVRQASKPQSAAQKKPEVLAREANIRELQDKLTHRLGYRVRIRSPHGSGKGEVVISFSSLDDFDSLIAKLCQA